MLLQQVYCRPALHDYNIVPIAEVCHSSFQDVSYSRKAMAYLVKSYIKILIRKAISFFYYFNR